MSVVLVRRLDTFLITSLERYAKIKGTAKTDLDKHCFNFIGYRKSHLNDWRDCAGYATTQEKT